MRVRPVKFPERFVAGESAKHSTKLKKDHTKGKEKIRIQHVKLIKKNLNIKKILCIGARDNSEVLSFINAGFEAIGIDVVPPSQHIKQVDAHKMDYKENEFDFVYSSHAFEHLYDPILVMKKVRNISKYGIFIVLPIAFKLKAGHPTNFDIMSNPPAEYTVPDSDFDSFAPNHVIEHYKRKEKGGEPELEIIFTWRN
jgi:hypothetical protein